MNAIVVLVWYRADPARSEEIGLLQQRLGERVERRFGVRGRFGWRDEPVRNRRTWLESWEPVDAAHEAVFVEALAAQARELGLDESVDGRYVDVFRWVDDDTA